ncbi:MAG TPA: hypothetical protein VF628_09955 [Allosphingosinicella sp.]|jgi:hypothetical protein
MLAVHSVIDTDGAFGRLKVIWVNWSEDAVVTVDADDDRSMPEEHRASELVRRMLENGWKEEVGFAPAYLADHVYVGDAASKQGKARQHHLDKRNTDWAIIAPMLADPLSSGVFHKKSRARLVAAASQLAVEAGIRGATPTTILKNLRRAFHGGMIPGSLLPKYANTGNPGEPRPTKEGGKKSGPPPKEGKPEGVPVTEELKSLFRLGWDLHEGDGQVSFVAAYLYCMRIGFGAAVQKLIDEHGARKIPLAAYEGVGLPRYEQFVWHYHRERKKWKALRTRLGSRVYDLTHRALLGNSTGEAWQPGARYQIDATVVNVYGRSKRNRRRILWRPTLYVVIDVWTRMIVGFALSYDPASWIGAMTALANAMTYKVAFCAKYGITITEQDWPSRHLCAILEGDNGEMKSAGVLGLIEQFGATIGNVTAFRADWKGIVERRFGLLDTEMKRFVPGVIRANFRERGVEDYRLKTELDLDELTAVFIMLILQYNNRHRIVGYPLTAEMIADKVPAVPVELWHWGVANCGLPAQPREEAVKFALLEQGEASVRRNGLFFRGATYSFPEAVEEGWFDQVSMTGGSKVRISFDRRFTDVIYVHDPKAPFGYRVAELTNELHAGCSFWELEDERQQSEAAAAWADLKEIVHQLPSDAEIDGIVAGASAKMAKTPPAASAAAETSGIRDATREEREFETTEQVAEYHASLAPPAVTPPTVPASIKPVPKAPSQRSANDDYAVPSLRDRLKRRI